jgi:predicted enzyme related to lactoylglutathione lyase
MAKYNVDIVIDCTDPEALADFWSEALGYRKLGSFETYVVLVPSTPEFPPVVLQHVPEPKAGKARIHLDIRADDVHAEAQRLEGIGAKRIDVGQADDAAWICMADPEGNEFCVCPGFPASSG